MIDAPAVRAALRGASLVIHTAALTDVDGCERDPQRAHEINANGTKNVVSGAREAGAKLIYISTDYVFPGTKNHPYEEDDQTGPLNAYGRTKLEGERQVRELAGSLIVRTSWVYGEGNNFVSTILRIAAEGRDLRVVDDQIGRPTWSEDIAGAIASLAPRAEGTVHYSAGGVPASWAGVAEYALGVRGLRTSVERVTTDDYVASIDGVLAPRPPYSVLSLRKARALGARVRDWREAVGAYVGGVS